MTRRSLFTSLAFVAGLGYARPKDGKGKGRRAREEEQEGGPRYGFLPREREEILGYYSGPSGLPPGLAKRGGNLPPGLEKQLRRNGTLPPGLQKKLVPLPAELDRRLPPCAPEYGRFQIGAHIVLMNRQTRIIADIVSLR